VGVVRGAARAETEQADQDLGEAQADRRAVQETSALIQQLSDLVHQDEDVIDMAPGISAGHDGVLVATLAPRHAAEIADLIRSRIGGEAASV